jgi:hypothetical protein
MHSRTVPFLQFVYLNQHQMSKEDVRLHKSTGADALPMNRLLAGEPAVPADSTMVQDAKDEAQDDGLKPSIDEAQAQPSVNDEGGPSGVRAVIGGFFIRCVAESVTRIASIDVGLAFEVADPRSIPHSQLLHLGLCWELDRWACRRLQCPCASVGSTADPTEKRWRRKLCRSSQSSNPTTKRTSSRHSRRVRSPG